MNWQANDSGMTATSTRIGNRTGRGGSFGGPARTTHTTTNTQHANILSSGSGNRTGSGGYFGGSSNNNRSQQTTVAANTKPQTETGTVQVRTSSGGGGTRSSSSGGGGGGGGGNAAPANTGPSQAELEAQRAAEAKAQYDQIEAQRQAELNKALANIPTLEAWLGLDTQYQGDVSNANTGWANNMTGWRNNLAQQTSAADFKTALDQLGWRGANVNDYTLQNYSGGGDTGQKVQGGLTGGEVSGGGWDKDYTYGAYGNGYQSLMNDAAARGMLNSTGYADNLANFNTDMNNQYASLLDARKNTATGIGTTADTGYGDYMAGLARYMQDSAARGATQYGVNSLKKNGAGAYQASDLSSPFQYQTQAYSGPVYW